MGQPGEAIAHLKAGLAADTDGSLYFQLSRAYSNAGQEEAAEAMLKKYQEIRKTSESAGISISPPDPH
jgi:predicted Zn-dependent protease